MLKTVGAAPTLPANEANEKAGTRQSKANLKPAAATKSAWPKEPAGSLIKLRGPHTPATLANQQ